MKVLEIEGELTCWRFSGHDGGKRRRDDIQQLWLDRRLIVPIEQHRNAGGQHFHHLFGKIYSCSYHGSFTGGIELNSGHRLQVAEDSRQVADEADGEDDRRRAVEEDAVLEAGVAAAGASSVIRDDKDDKI